jgi:hypothetical protein
MSGEKQPGTLPMHQRLTELLAQDPEDRLSGHISRRLEHPLEPRTRDGHFRINPLLLILGAVALIGVSIFFFFSYGVL